MKDCQVDGSRAVYLQPVNMLPTFSPRVQDGLCLLHEAGGVYRSFSKSCTVRTKHVRFLEEEIPEMDIFGQDGNNSEGEEVEDDHNESIIQYYNADTRDSVITSSKIIVFVTPFYADVA